MKIAVLQDDFPPETKGGSAVAALNLAKGFLSRGHQVFVIAAVQDKNKEGIDRIEGLEIRRIFSDYHPRWRAYLSLYNPQTVSKVKKFLNEIKPDIVHAHNIHQHLSYHTLKLAKQSGAHVFLTAHDSMLYDYGKSENDSKISRFRQLIKNKLRYNPFRNVIIKHYLNYADKIITVSDSLKEALVNNGIKNTAVVHNGINLNNWIVPQNKIDEFIIRHNLMGKKVVLFGGRLSRAKGGEQIIKAMTQVVKKMPEAVLLIAGKRSAYAEEMFGLAEKLGVENNVVFSGWLKGTELAAAYRSSGVVVFPSIYLDPFGMVNIEAMACFRPVIATSFGGAKEIVQDGVTGYIVNPFDIQKLAGRIIEILENPVLAEKLGKAGYKRAAEAFTLGRQADSYLKIFNLFLNK